MANYYSYNTNQVQADINMDNAIKDIQNQLLNIPTDTQLGLKANQSDLDTTNANVAANTSSLATKALQTDLNTTNANVTANQKILNSHMQDVVPHEDFLLYDSFGRANSTTSIGNVETNGNAYTIISTDSSHIWGINGQQAYVVSGTANARGIAYQETNETDGIIELNITGVSSTICGVAFRVVDINSFWVFSLLSTGWNVTKYVSGTSTSLTGGTVGGITSGKLTVICNKNKLEFYINDILVYETYDSANNTATKHGLYSRVDANVRYDNFNVRKVAKKKQYNIILNGATTPLPWYAWTENASQSYSYSQSPTIKYNGMNSFRFELDYGDPDSSVGSKRSELRVAAEKPLSEYWYSVDMYLPNGGTEDYGTDSMDEIITQWHSSPDSAESSITISPPLSLRAQNGRYHLFNSWDSDFIMPADNDWFGKGQYVDIDLGDYSADKGKWVNWTYHIKWGWLAAQNPILEVYKDGVQVVNRNGLPNTYNDQVGVYFKVGIYKWGWSTSSSNVTKRVIYYNNIAIK